MNRDPATASVSNESGTVLISKLEIAKTLRTRMRGLLGRDGLDDGCGMLITPCSSIHTYFMRFTIDVVFLDRDYKVLQVDRNIPPWRMVFAPPKTRLVMEVASGWLAEDSIHTGEQLNIEF